MTAKYRISLVIVNQKGLRKPLPAEPQKGTSTLHVNQSLRRHIRDIANIVKQH